jgi:hypothetical protein
VAVSQHCTLQPLGVISKVLMLNLPVSDRATARSTCVCVCVCWGREGLYKGELGRHEWTKTGLISSLCFLFQLGTSQRCLSLKFWLLKSREGAGSMAVVACLPSMCKDPGWIPKHSKKKKKRKRKNIKGNFSKKIYS